MLNKLLKYELKSIFKFLMIFYGLSLLFSALARVFLSVEGSLIMEIIGEIFRGAAISMMFSSVINNVMRMWVRYKQNFFGDESYLTHTLPIKKSTLMLSKIIASVITLVCSTLVVAISIFIAYYSKENLETLKALFIVLEDIHNFKILPFAIMLFAVLFLEFLNIILCGFAGITLGHRMGNAKTGFSILFGMIVYSISQISVLAVAFLFGFVNGDIMNLFFTNSAVSSDVFYTLIFICVAAYLVLNVVMVFVNTKLFKKGVNVE